MLAILILLIIFMTIFSYLFLHLPSYTKLIDKFIFKTSGYHIRYPKMSTSFNKSWQPTIQIDNLSVYKSDSQSSLLRINYIGLALSYQSFIKFKPILSSLNIIGSNISLKYDKKDNLLLNNHVIANFAATPESSFDIENLILTQKEIFLKNINLTIVDAKYRYLKPISLSNLTILLKNLGGDRHNLNTNFGFDNQSQFTANMQWRGALLTDISTWQSGSVNIENLTQLGYQIHLKANINKGVLAYLQTKFDSNAQKLANLNSKARNVTDFSGQVEVKQLTPESYQVIGNNITINTKTGYLFNNSSLQGRYISGIGGQLSLDNLNFAGVNSLLKLYSQTKKISLAGYSSCQVSWKGNVAAPQKTTFSAKFNSISLNSNESDIPSIDNISATLFMQENSGSLGLVLANSTIKYPKQFNKPLLVQNFTTNTSWYKESGNKIKLDWQNTSLRTADFLLNSQGAYQTESNYLNLTVKISNFNLAHLDNYLPNLAPKDVKQYIAQSLSAGKLDHGNLNIQGPLKQFPFKANNGSLQFNADITRLQYKFLPDWGAVSNLNGKIDMDNQNIRLKINSGNVGLAKLKPSTVTVPDWAESKTTLHLKSQVQGNTQNYLDYLLTTPFKDILSLFRDKVKVKVKGNSNLDLKLDLPLTNPGQFKLQGKYIPLNNTLIISNPGYNITNIHGAVNFNQNGLSKSQLNAYFLDSQLNFSVLNQDTLKLYVPNLNYTELLKTIYSPLGGVINGHAATSAIYNLKTEQLKVKSDLDGVTIAGARPLIKTESETAPLNINMFPHKDKTRITFNYNELLQAQADFTEDMEFKRLKVGLGTHGNYRLTSPLQSAPITVRADLANTYITEWVDLINRLIPGESTNQQINLSSKNSESFISPNNYLNKTADGKEIESLNKLITHINTASPIFGMESSIYKSTNNDLYKHSSTSHNRLYPVQIEVNSNAYWLKDYKLTSGQTNVVINPKQIDLNLATSNITGIASYQPQNNYLNVKLDKVLYSNANYAKNQHTLASANPSLLTSTNLAIPYQSESFIMNQNKETIPQSPNLLKLPKIDFAINNIYYESRNLGALQGKTRTDESSLYIESASLVNKAAATQFRISDNCVGCDTEYTFIVITSQINDFGLLMDKFDQSDIFAKGNGAFYSILEFNSGITKFDSKKLYGNAILRLEDGQLVQVNPGIFGSLLGVVSLGSINPLKQFSLNNLFGKGFAYEKLYTLWYLDKENVKIKKLGLMGQIANISTFGDLNLADNSIDTYLVLEPRLNNTIATTAGIITLNPAIGVAVYLGQRLTNSPIDKALAVSYHITGSIESPVLTQTKLSDQIIENLNSSVNIFKK